MKLRDITRYLALTAAIAMAARTSYVHLGGWVMGGAGNLLDVEMFVAPCLALPIALVACRKSRLGVVLWMMMATATLTGEITAGWPHISTVYTVGGLYSFIVGGLLLVVAALLERCSWEYWKGAVLVVCLFSVIAGGLAWRFGYVVKSRGYAMQWALDKEAVPWAADKKAVLSIDDKIFQQDVERERKGEPLVLIYREVGHGYCWSSVYSKEVAFHLMATGKVRVPVEYYTISNYGRLSGDAVKSVDGIPVGFAPEVTSTNQYSNGFWGRICE